MIRLLPRFQSLGARLVLLVGVAFLPMFAITANEVVEERRALIQRAHEREAQRVEAAVAAQEELLADGKRYLSAIALLEPVAQGDTVACSRTVQRVRQLLAEGWSFARYSALGAVDCTTDRGVGAIETITTRELPGAPGDPDATVVASYGIDRNRNAPVVTLLRSVGRPDGTWSRVAITMHMAWMDALVRGVTRDSLGVVAITDDLGRLLARYPAIPAAGSVQGGNRTAVYDSMLARRHGVVDAAGLDGVRRVWIFRAMPSPAGRVVFLSVGIPATPIASAANATLVRSALTLACTVLLVVLAAWWAARRFVMRDVHALLGATERIAAGDLSSRSGITARHGELGRLADAFDGMASKLEHRQERLAHAQKMESVGQLAGGVAHDFNNLLTAIVANTEAAKDALDPAHPAQEELGHVLHAARRSGQLTRQLLAFARQHTFATRVLTLDRLLANVSTLLHRVIGEHIRLIVECDPGLKPTRVDPTQIEQAVMNLAVNARDAMPQGGTLTITVRNVHADAQHTGDEADPPGRWVAITVTDSGTGMAPDVQRRVFEPFFTTKPVGSGTGLGLSMVYGTVRQHGGHVQISSTVGKGTSVRLLLPAEEAAELSNETPALGVPPVRATRGNETILLVEDEAAVRNVSARLLRAQGYQVIEAPEGAAALEAAARVGVDTIDLVLTDLVMPTLGGEEVVNRLRASRATLPALVMSGYSASGVSTELLEAPFTGFIEKPFSSRTLLSAVRSLLDGGAVQEEHRAATAP